MMFGADVTSTEVSASTCGAAKLAAAPTEASPFEAGWFGVAGSLPSTSTAAHRQQGRGRGCRRAQRQPRSSRPAGRAVIGFAVQPA